MPITRRTLAATVLAAVATPVGAAGSGFTPRLKVPRLPPIPPEARSPAQKAMMAKRSEFNIYKTLAAHPVLYERWSDFGQFILNGSSLPARHREMLILRMGWLCQAEYEWAQHARIATGAVGLDPPDLRRIAEGPGARGWTAFERALLTACDEIRYEEMISEPTWRTLRTQYSDVTVMDALFTCGQYQLVSMVLNSLGVQVDTDLTYRLPKDVPQPRVAGVPMAKALAAPRIAPKPVSAMTADDKELLAERYLANGTVMNLYATLINHPKLYGPRAKFGSYIQRDSGLPPRTRELAILRTAVNVSCDYEWEHHVSLAKTAGLTNAEIERVKAGPDAKGWSAVDAATLRAADELRREAFISDKTWATLKGAFNAQRLIEIVFTIGGYAMTGAAIRSFGIQLEPEYRK